ncbi:MAG: DUF3592 domain-containing protein [Acidobacteriota bacterium]
MQNNKLVLLILYGMCAIPIAVAIVMGYMSWKAISGSLRTQGTVVAFVGSSSADSNTEAPLVDYQVEGEAHRIRGDVFISFSAYSVGETVTVLYKQEHPEDGTINSFTELWFGPVAFGGAGLIAVAFVNLALSRQKKFRLRSAEIKQNPELMRLIKEINEKSESE